MFHLHTHPPGWAEPWGGRLRTISQILQNYFRGFWGTMPIFSLFDFGGPIFGPSDLGGPVFGPSHLQLGLLGPPSTLDQPLYWAYTVSTYILLPFSRYYPFALKPFLWMVQSLWWAQGDVGTTDELNIPARHTPLNGESRRKVVTALET
jgi:hypothetical protein